jgi:hypothetical protein
VAHLDDSAEWAEDMLERVQDSQHEAVMRLGSECKGERCMNLIDEKGEEGQHFG